MPFIGCVPREWTIAFYVFGPWWEGGGAGGDGPPYGAGIELGPGV